MTSLQKTQTTDERIQTLREVFARIEEQASHHRVTGINVDGDYVRAIADVQRAQLRGLNMALSAVSGMLRDAEGRKCKTNH